MVDDLRLVRRSSAKKLLAKAKKEAARRWLHVRFDPTEMVMELSQEREDDDCTVDFDERLLKQRAVDSIDDVMSTIDALRGVYANLAGNTTQSAAHKATVAARVAFGYPKERPSRSDCFEQDVRRQCRRAINEVYRRLETSSGPTVYLISAGDPKFVKIGFTTCLEQRLRSLRTASHVEPVVLLAIPGTRSLERELHIRFASARHSREWFRLTEEVEGFIALGSSECPTGACCPKAVKPQDERRFASALTANPRSLARV
jgi:hypothetical protein